MTRISLSSVTINLFSMRPLSKLQSYILLLGGVLMVVGSGAYVIAQQWGAGVFALGAIMFASMQMRQSYEGSDFTIRRLRRIQLCSDMLFLLAALLMIANESNFLGLDYLTYIQYVHNNWVILLLVAAVLQLYSGHRIANELEKHAQ